MKYFEEEQVFKQRLGSKLATARKKAKFTQKQVATQFGISQDIVSKYELGTREPSLYTLTQFAKLYEKPVIHFFN